MSSEAESPMSTTASDTPTTTTTGGAQHHGSALLADATRLGGVELTVTYLDRAIDFYTRVIGLSVHERDERSAALGAGGEDLVTLALDARARPARRHAGLYHYALLFPTREELGRVARRVAETRIGIDGASDHGTHEAIYLPDPDGNGIELAADRPREQWPDVRGGDLFVAGPQPLDVGALLAAVDGEETRPLAEGGLRMGHVHLHVGDLDAATRFYRDGLGFEVMATLPTAVFVAAGGYHHHVAFNVWRGVGVGAAPAGTVGLRHWTLITQDAAEHQAVRDRLVAQGAELEERADGTLARDPFGIAVLIR
jgi:catechol 2,3-dioxygenase